MNAAPPTMMRGGVALLRRMWAIRSLASATQSLIVTEMATRLACLVAIAETTAS